MISSPPPTADHVPRAGARRPSVLVVGGGIAGVSAAYRLSLDCQVILLEREAMLGTHATGRSAATLSETSGTRVMCALARASRPVLENPHPEFCTSPLTRPRGLLWIGRDGDDPALDAIADAAADGISASTRRMDADGTRRLLPALRPHAVDAGGVFEPDARALDVDLLLRSYARGAALRGAEIRSGTELLAAHRSGGMWQVSSSTGSIEADVIVNASGAWGDVIARRCGVRELGLLPLRRSACIARTDRNVAEWPLVMDIANRCYFEPESGGLLLSPADEHLSDPVDAGAEEIDIALGIEMLNDITDLEVRSVQSVWAGLRTFTADRNPAVGPDDEEPGFVWLVGQGGAGIKSAPAMADVAIAAMGMADWPSALSDLGIGRHDLAPDRLR